MAAIVPSFMKVPWTIFLTGDFQDRRMVLRVRSTESTLLKFWRGDAVTVGSNSLAEAVLRPRFTVIRSAPSVNRSSQISKANVRAPAHQSVAEADTGLTMEFDQIGNGNAAFIAGPDPTCAEVSDRVNRVRQVFPRRETAEQTPMLLRKSSTGTATAAAAPASGLPSSSHAPRSGRSGRARPRMSSVASGAARPGRWPRWPPG